MSFSLSITINGRKLSLRHEATDLKTFVKWLYCKNARLSFKSMQVRNIAKLTR